MTGQVLVAGGGTAALELVLALNDLAGDRVHVTLVAPEAEFVPRPLLVAEPLGAEPRRRLELAELADELGFTFHRAAVAEVEAGQRRVTLRGGGTLAYDTLVLAPGARRLPAFDDAIHVGVDDGTLEALRAQIESGEVRSVAFVAPTTTGWLLPLYEAALLTAGLGARATFTGAVPEEFREALSAAGVELRDAPPEDADRLVSLPLIRGPRIPGVPETGLYGLIAVDEHLRVIGLDDVYAIGDATDYPVKQGGIACQQADAAAEHIAHHYGAPLTPRPFSPELVLRLEFGPGRLPGRVRYPRDVSFA